MPSPKPKSVDAITRRLLPLYASTTLSGFMLWYAIEKVYMSRLGFSAAQITLAAIAVSVTILLTEVPLGIIADRKSRKSVLTFGFACLAAACALLPLAGNVLTYILLISLIGLYFAAESGISESIIYDTLIELRGKREGYERYYGRVQGFMSVTLVISSLLGGYVASHSSLQAAYFWSLPAAVGAIVCSLFIREPKAHKDKHTTYLLHHIRETFAAVLRRGTVAWIMLAVICFGMLDYFLLDIDQLWPLALALPIIWYGPLNAFLLLGQGLGGPLAGWLAEQRQKLIGALVCLIALICVLLLSVANIYIIAIAQFGFIVCFSSLLIVAEGRLQDELPSRLRTGAISVASSLTTVCFIPVAYVFGLITDHYNVFRASYMLIPITLAGIVGYLVFRNRRQATVRTIVDR